MAEVQRRRDQLAEAETALELALAIQEKAARPDRLKRANTLNAMAIILAQRGKFSAAEKKLRDSLADRL